MSCYSRACRSLRTFGMCLHWNQEAKNQKSGFERNWVWHMCLYTVQNVSPTFRLHVHTQSNEYSRMFDVCEGFHLSSTVTLDSVKIHVQNETSPCQKQYLKTKTWRCSTPICNTTNQLCHLQNRSQCAVYLPNPTLLRQAELSNGSPRQPRGATAHHKWRERTAPKWGTTNNTSQGWHKIYSCGST